MSFERFPFFSESLYTLADPQPSGVVEEYLPDGFYLKMQGGTLFVESAPKKSFWSKVGKFFTFQQDKNLLEVSLEFQKFAQNLWRQDTPEFEKAYEKLANNGNTSREVALMHEFAKIDNKFKRANSKHLLTLVALKIVNFFRSIFGMKKIEFKKYLPIPVIPVFSAMKTQINAEYMIKQTPAEDVATCPLIKDYLQVEWNNRGR